MYVLYGYDNIITTLLWLPVLHDVVHTHGMASYHYDAIMVAKNGCYGPGPVTRSVGVVTKVSFTSCLKYIAYSWNHHFNSFVAQNVVSMVLVRLLGPTELWLRLVLQVVTCIYSWHHHYDNIVACKRGC